MTQTNTSKQGGLWFGPQDEATESEPAQQIEEHETLAEDADAEVDCEPAQAT